MNVCKINKQLINKCINPDVVVSWHISRPFSFFPFFWTVSCGAFLLVQSRRIKQNREKDKMSDLMHASLTRAHKMSSKDPPFFSSCWLGWLIVDHGLFIWQGHWAFLLVPYWAFSSFFLLSSALYWATHPLGWINSNKKHLGHNAWAYTHLTYSYPIFQQNPMA